MNSLCSTRGSPSPGNRQERPRGVWAESGAGRGSTHCRLMCGGNLKEFFSMWSCWIFPGCPAWIAPVISKAHESLSSREQASRKYSVEVWVFSLMRSCENRQPDSPINTQGESVQGLLAAGRTGPERTQATLSGVPSVQPLLQVRLCTLMWIHPRQRAHGLLKQPFPSTQSIAEYIPTLWL